MAYYRIGFETPWAGCDEYEMAEANSREEAEEMAQDFLNERCQSFAEEGYICSECGEFVPDEQPEDCDNMFCADCHPERD